MNGGAWCNGSTPDFGSVDLGSTPGASAVSIKRPFGRFFRICGVDFAVFSGRPWCPPSQPGDLLI